ncbi:MAG TPA: cob(I)yrinic acid a,c-diamide adenosyltransferase [Candidatus Stackebrandtia faecavium]|nr:cob(I)yrinic acid a,c-diamide adenosyltransferase [Candidatus Stackebrandtia faecavium]
MSVHVTKVYTKTGDKGTTGLSDFSRVSKTHPRITAYADVDETNSVIGVALALGDPRDEVKTVLTQIQNDMFDVGADLSTPVAQDPKYPPLRITDAYVTRLENWCDTFNANLPKLNSFILRGGNPTAALLHQACTVARRAERSAWAIMELEPETTHTTPTTYLNRLSDLLFILARDANEGDDVLWKPAENA